MLNVIAFGLAAGVGIQALAGWDTGGEGTRWSLAVAFLIGIVCAYLGGRSRRGGATATAIASASAEASATAQNQVNLVVMTPGVRASSPSGVAVPTTAAPWLSGATDRPAISADDLDGMDVAELLGSPDEYEA